MRSPPPGGTNVALSAAHRADSALREAYALRGSPRPDALEWDDYHALVDALAAGLRNGPEIRRFTYEHPVRLQDPEVGFGKPYPVPLAFSDSGGDGEPLIAIGGLTNVSQRFDFLALDAAPALRVIGLDLAGRGGSGWLAGAGRLSPGNLCRAAYAAHGPRRSRIVHPARLVSRRLDRNPVRGAASRTRPPAGAQRQQPRTFPWNDGRAGQGRWHGTTCSAARPSCFAAPERPRNTPDPRLTRCCSTAPITEPVGRMRKRVGSTGTTCEHFSPIEPRPDAASTCGATGPR